MGKAAAPVSIDDAIYDQASRYGLGLDEYLHGSSNTYTAGSDLPSTFYKGNPFFTAINQPTVAKTQTINTPRPFIWQGNNSTLRQGYQASFDAYQKQNPKKADFEQQATWQGPQIRPEYTGEVYSNGLSFLGPQIRPGSKSVSSNGLSFLGTANYWQDNNKNDVYDFGFDDKLTANPNQPISPPTPVTTTSTPQWEMPQEPRVPQIGDEDYKYQLGDIDYNPRGQIRDEYGYQIAGPYFNSDGMYVGEWEDQYWS